MRNLKKIIAAGLSSIMLLSAAFSSTNLLPASAAGYTAEQIENYITAQKGFSANKLDEYQDYYDCYTANSGYNVPSIERLKNAIEFLDNGTDYYDDFENFGTYETNELDYPTAAGQVFPTDENTSNYEIIWSGLKNDDGIKRLPYSSKASTAKSLFGVNNGRLSFSNYDFDYQLYKGLSTSVISWYNSVANETFGRGWQPGTFKLNNENSGFNIVTLKNNILNSSPVQSIKLTYKRGGNQPYLIYNYTDGKNWSAVGLNGHASASIIMFRCIDGKLYSNDGSTPLSGSKFTDQFWGEHLKIKAVCDAIPKNNNMVDYILEYNDELGEYQFKIASGDTVSNYFDLLPGERITNLYLCTAPISQKNTYIDEISICNLSATKVIKSIEKLPDINDLTRFDAATVRAVESDYQKLSDELKEEVYNYSKLYDALARIKKLEEEYDNSLTLKGKVLTFEDGSGNEYFQENSSLKIIDNPAKDSVNNSDKVFMTDTNTAILKKRFTGTTAIITGRVYLKFYSGCAVIYPTYIDKDNYTAVSFGAGKTGEISVGFSGKLDGKGYNPADYGQDVMSGLKWNSGWADFRIMVNGTVGQLLLGTLGSDGKYYYSSCEWQFKLCAASDYLFAFAGNTTAKCYLDDLAIAYNDVDEYYNAQYFLESNSYILNLYPFEDFLSNMDRADVEKLLDDYSRLSDLEKAYIGGDTCHKVAAIQELFPNITTDDTEIYNDAANYYRLDDNADKYSKSFRAFTSSDNDNRMTQFTPTFRRHGMASIVKDETLGRNVLRLGSNIKLTLKDKFVSPKSVLKEVSYKIRATEEIKALSGWQANHPKLTINVVESDTKKYVIELNKNYYKATTQSGNYEPDENGRVFDVNTTISVKITYKIGIANVTLVDGNGVVLKIKMNIPQNIPNRLTFTTNANDGTRGYHVITFATEVWDIRAYFMAGDWDDNVTQTDIKVNYTGNTYQAPGDIALIRGENIGNVVKSAKLIRLDDNMTAFGFIDKTSYDYDGVHTGEFNYEPVSSTFAADSEVWNDETRVSNLSIIHKEEDSIKFIIPKNDAAGNTMKNGIYAVLLKGNYGADKRARVIYLNAPWIDYTIGNDGELCTPGTEVDIIGENLAPNQQLSGKAKADYKRTMEKTVDELKVRMWKSGDRSRYWDLEITDVKSAYALSVMIPKNITVPADGSTVTYELSVYNGYGDSTAWSIPYKIKLGKSIQSQIPDNIINIKDEGATGTYDQNVTSIMQNAITKLYNMGGGTLYLPEGVYRTEYTVYIPKNINIIGEARDLTCVLPTYLSFGVKQAPTFAFELAGNNKLSTFTVYFMRGLRVFQSKGTAANVEISNILFYGNPTAWSNNAWGAAKPIGGEAILSYLVAQEASQGNNGIVSGIFENLKITDFTCEVNKGDLCLINSYNAADKYFRFENVEQDSNDTWNRALASHSIYENCSLSGNNATEARGVYHHNVTFRKAIGYNRELWVADRPPESGIYWQYMPVDENGNIDMNGSTENSVYIKPESTRDIYKMGFYATQQRQIYVVSGNGVGQTREIVGVDTEKGCLIIDRPFDVAINRNSRLTVRTPREDIYFYDVIFHEGAAGGFFGGGADVVYDGVYHNRHVTLYQHAIFGDVNWYMSTVNDVWENTPYNISAVFGVSKSYTYQWKEDGVATNYLQVGILMRNNDVSGMSMNIDSYNNGNLKDFIIDNNRFDEMPYAIEFSKNGTPDGLIFYRNTGNKLTNLMKGGDTNSANALGNKYCLMLENGDGKITLGRNYGDVNNDGEVTLKDVSAIRYYLVGEYDLDDNDKIYTDVNNDGIIDLQDALYIQYFVSGEITSLPVTDD